MKQAITQQGKRILEIGLNEVPEEGSVEYDLASNAVIAWKKGSAATAIVLADWLEERGRVEEATRIRWFCESMQSLTGVLAVEAGKWSVVRRLLIIRPGVKAFDKEKLRSTWERMTIEVQRTTPQFAVLTCGKRMGLQTFSGVAPAK